MPKGHHLEFKCCQCQHPICFSIYDLDSTDQQSICPGCEQRYAFNDPVLLRQIRKFAALCEQVRESEEILSTTSVAIDIGPHHVKFPYKLLLTRLNSQLELKMGDQSLTLTFRVEPLRDSTEQANTSELVEEVTR